VSGENSGQDVSPRVSAVLAAGIAMTVDRGTKADMDSVSAKISALELDNQDGAHSTRTETVFPAASFGEPSMFKVER
jgi:hypothetical protein